jgi:hypothetical protein
VASELTTAHPVICHVSCCRTIRIGLVVALTLSTTPEEKMRTSQKKKIALGLIVFPLLIGIVLQLSGSDSFVVEWQGTLSSPESTRFEFHNFGAVLLLASLIGLLWLSYLLISGLFSKSPRNDSNA